MSIPNIKFFKNGEAMIQKTILDNGLTIITDKKDGDFVTAAYYVDVGSIDENENTRGIAHLTEHLVFKGTATRDKNELMREIQDYGGEINAATTEMYTYFYSTILKEYWKTVLEIVSDIVWNNTIPEEEFELEKSVVIEELKMYDDDARDRVFSLMTKTLFKDCKNRWNNGGTPETVSKITREQVIDFISKNYIPKNITVCFTGDVEHQEIVSFVKNYIDGYEFSQTSYSHRKKITQLNIENAKEKLDGTQSTMIAVWNTIMKNVKDMFVCQFATTILGGGWGSRMMEIREEYGYAYTVTSTFDTYGFDDVSYVGIYVGLNKENIPKTKEIILENLKKLNTQGITQQEFMQAKRRMMSSLKRNYITCDDRTLFMFDSLCLKFDIFEEQDYVNLIEEITFDDVNNYVKNWNIDNIAFMIMEQSR